MQILSLHQQSHRFERYLVVHPPHNLARGVSDPEDLSAEVPPVPEGPMRTQSLAGYFMLCICTSEANALSNLQLPIVTAY